MGCKSTKERFALHPEVIAAVEQAAIKPSENNEFKAAVAKGVTKHGDAAAVLSDEGVVAALNELRLSCNVVKPAVFEVVKRHHSDDVATAEGKRRIGSAIVEHANKLLEAGCLQHIENELRCRPATAADRTVCGSAAQALHTDVLNAMREVAVVPSENKEFAAAVQKALPRCSTAAAVLNDSEVAAAVATMREQCNVIKPSVFRAVQRHHGSEIGTAEGKRLLGSKIIDRANQEFDNDCLSFIETSMRSDTVDRTAGGPSAATVVLNEAAVVPSENKEFTAAVHNAAPRCSSAAQNDTEVAAAVATKTEARPRQHAPENISTDGKQMATANQQRAEANSESRRAPAPALSVAPNVATASRKDEAATQSSLPTLHTDVLTAMRAVAVVPSENKEFAAAVQKALPRCSTAAAVLNDSEVAAAVATMREQCHVIKPSVFKVAKQHYASDVSTAEGKRKIGSKIVEVAHHQLASDCLQYVEGEVERNGRGAPPLPATRPQGAAAVALLLTNEDANVTAGSDVLPLGNWTKVDAEGVAYYYSEEENLYYHPSTGQFYDPSNEMWYDPAADEWYSE